MMTETENKNQSMKNKNCVLDDKKKTSKQVKNKKIKNKKDGTETETLIKHIKVSKKGVYR
jgi:Mor family transcriptional regulator